MASGSDEAPTFILYDIRSALDGLPVLLDFSWSYVSWHMQVFFVRRLLEV